jgi:hypothetical protein
MTDLRPGDKVRAGRVEGVVVKLRAGMVLVKEDKLFGRPVTWSIDAGAVVKVP